MSGEGNKAVFHQLIEEGFNRGNLDALDEFFAPDFTEHEKGIEPPTLEGMKAQISNLRRMLPDLKLTIEDITEDGDKIWARTLCRGTNLGEVLGLPPTGKSIEIDVIDICRFESGKIVEHWGVSDSLGMLEQLGIMPWPPQATS